LIPAGVWACGPRQDAIVFAVGGAPSELVYWESLCREFESRYDIAVELLRQPSDTDQRRQSLVVALSAHMPNPDVFLMDLSENRDPLVFMRDLIWKHHISPPNTYTEMKEEQARIYFQAGDALFERKLFPFTTSCPRSGRDTSMPYWPTTALLSRL
jgi:multiple sugar transport system substrate-binding protein